MYDSMRHSDYAWRIDELHETRVAMLHSVVGKQKPKRPVVRSFVSPTMWSKCNDPAKPHLLVLHALARSFCSKLVMDGKSRSFWREMLVRSTYRAVNATM
jgi:hypothetical protein